MHRAGRADPDAARLLQDFARLPIGTKDERFAFLRLLQEQRLIGPTDLIDDRDGTQLRRINLFNVEIHLHGSMALLNRARGEREVADSLIASLERMVQNEDDARQLTFAKNLQRSIGHGASVTKAISALARLARNPKRG